MVTHFYATSVSVNYLIQISNDQKFHYVPHYVIIRGETLEKPHNDFFTYPMTFQFNVTFIDLG
jgi:hypothetical protein